MNKVKGETAVHRQISLSLHDTMKTTLPIPRRSTIELVKDRVDTSRKVGHLQIGLWPETYENNADRKQIFSSF